MRRLTESEINQLNKATQKDKEAYEEYVIYEEKFNERFSTLTDKQQRLYNNTELNSLVLEFWYICQLLCRYKTLNIKKSYTDIKPYNVDIVTVLYLIKVIHTIVNRWKKKNPIPNRKLIVVWWLSLDEEYLKMYTTVWGNEILKDYMLKNHSPAEYQKYLRDGDMNKLRNKNSFHKYLWTAINHWLKEKIIDFLWVLLSELELTINMGKSQKNFKWKILNVYSTGFGKILEKIPMKRKSTETNYDYIVRKYRWIGWYKSVLDVVKVRYKKSLLKELKLSSVK